MKAKFYLCINLLFLGLTLTGCRRSTNEVWDDTRTAGRYAGRGMRSLGGKNTDSRQIRNPNEFYVSNKNPSEAQYEFIPLHDDNGYPRLSTAESSYPQPLETPGDPGSSLPGIEAFKDPSLNPNWANIFQNIHFDFNSSLIKGQENLQTIRVIGEYLKSHEGVYIFVEGHTDERGPEAYNLALGSHRSNSVRNLLIKEGANPDNIFTVSYGKEHPILMEHHEEAWSINRRAEFKVYQRS